MVESGVSYGFGTTLAVGQDEAIGKVTGALKAEGFGVLTTIDVQATLKEKIGAETAPYVILGACNPTLAHQALEREPEIGLLLPCNVVVRQTANGTVVEIADPQAMLGLAGGGKLDDLAAEARTRLERVVAALARPGQEG